MEWTTDRPTEPGWYWVIDKDEIIDAVVELDGIRADMIYLFQNEDKSFSVWWAGVGQDIDVQEIVFWLGPVPEPDPPKQLTSMLQ